MATELQIQKHHATSASNIWHKMMKSASCRDTKSPNAVKEIANNTITDKKSIDASKKLCLCAPTTHAGSFKCRLHRASSTQKSSPLSESTGGDNESINCMNVNGKPHVSRFGAAAAVVQQATTTSH